MDVGLPGNEAENEAEELLRRNDDHEQVVRASFLSLLSLF